MPDNLTILYAEDEPDDVFFMNKAFSRAGVASKLRTVADGDRAIAYLAGHPPYDNRDEHPLPELVLLDVNLPIRSGFDVLAWLRGRDDLRCLKVIMFSSSGRPEDRAHAQALGANDYILKPASGVSFLEVAEQIKNRWLSQSSQSPT